MQYYIKNDFWNLVTCSWLNPLLAKGNHETLEKNDIPKLESKNSAFEVTKHFDLFWANIDRKPSLIKTLVGPIYYQLVLYYFLNFIKVLVDFFLSPLIFGQIILWLQNGNSSLIISNITALVVLYFGLQIGIACCSALVESLIRRISTVLSTMLMAAIYEKSFRLSQKSRKEFSTGKIINMINNDSRALSEAPRAVNSLWSIPFSVVIGILYLLVLVGNSVWASVGYAVVSFISTLAISVLMSKYYDAYLTNNDARITKIREMLNGIQVVKFKAMEDYFVRQIQKLREMEGDNYVGFIYVLAFGQLLSSVAPILMPIVTFAVYSATNGKMDPQIIFPAMLIFQRLYEPLLSVSGLSQTYVMTRQNWQRVRDFLLAEEGSQSEQNHLDKDVAIKIENATWTYLEEEKESQKQFNGINVTVPKGSLVAIVGNVGSGKSTLLSSLIGDLELTAGTFDIKGKIAYCSQEPWIMGDSIKNNILFGSKEDKLLLLYCIKAACLASDLENLSAGMNTEIGEEGSNLSGGQKARLSLARALYKDSDVYLLDCPLAALDASVGRKVFDMAIKEFLAHKTVLMVTHQLHYLPQFDKVIVMEEGSVKEYGSYQELMSKNGALVKLMENYQVSEDDQSTQQEIVESKEFVEKDGGQFTEQEEVEKGSVQGSVFLAYMKAMGNYPLQIILILGYGATLVGDVWSKLWITQVANVNNHIPSDRFIEFYTIAGAINLVGNVISRIFRPFLVIAASTSLHNMALNGVVNAPLSFFQRNPSGRILNRFSTDIDETDSTLCYVGSNLPTILLEFIACAILTAQASGYISIFLFAVFVIYYYIYKFFQNSNLAMQRIESVLKSPMDAHVSQSLTALSTIKAFNVQKQFEHKQHKLIDQYQASYFVKTSLAIWLSFRLSILSQFITLLVIVYGVLSKSNGSVNVEAVALAIQSSSDLGRIMEIVLEFTGLGEATMNSVERLLYYGNSLSKESARVSDYDSSLEAWPTKGKVEFEKVGISYPTRPDHFVIKNLSLIIQPGEKLGVIGRTGSGKSTLMTSLFRIMELTKGSIFIDGQDISKCGLKKLRQSIQIIPQDPVLFKGTIRTNLDPESEFHDDKIWESLQFVGLKEYFQQQADKLDTGVDEKGESLSLGQRQLICLARSILAQPKILVMDEATAAVDGESDQLIQKVLKTFFLNTTVISIAHRLNTIAGFDRVLVLSDGIVVECDSPFKLLQDPNSLFSRMTNDSGSANAKMIRKAAQELQSTLG
ncbi:hypothetical protein HDV01_007835 [Terramyces sp. JEL0728]|nr:hypothetical protein HDV01_007835 [Terramyces sp. JEL0728]